MSSELRERLQDRVALFEFVDRLGIAHRGMRFFPAGQGEPAAELQAFLDQNRGQTLESPWWVSSQNRTAGLDRWSPTRELQARDRESWRLVTRFPGGYLVESALDTARRVRVFWRRPSLSGALQLSDLWDISLSEARAGPELVHRRVHLAISPAPGLEAVSSHRVLSDATKILEGLRAVGEGSVDFFVDGERTFLADAQVDIEPWYSRFSFLSDPSQVRCLGLIHLLDPRTFLPQPGSLRATVAAPSLEPFWISPHVEQGSWMESGVAVAVCAQGATLEAALSGLREACDSISFAGTADASLPYLQELVASPWVCDGHFHFKFLEDDFIPAGRPLESWEVARILSALSSHGDCFSIDGRLFHAADRFADRSDPESELPVNLELLGDEAWLVRTEKSARLVRRIADPRARELRAQCAGRVLTLENTARDFGGGALLVLESGGVWIPHAVSSVLAPRLKWRLSPGEQVHRGQLLARVE